MELGVSKVELSNISLSVDSIDKDYVIKVRKELEGKNSSVILRTLGSKMDKANNLILDKVKVNELDDISVMLKSVMGDIKNIDTKTLLVKDSKGSFVQKLFGKRVAQKVEDLVTKMTSVDDIFKSLHKTLMECQIRLNDDIATNSQYLEDIQDLGRETIIYIKALEDIYNDKVAKLNNKLDIDTTGLNDLEFLRYKDELGMDDLELKGLNKNLVALHTQLMLLYNNANILRELLKTGEALDTHLNMLVINDLPNIKQQIAISINILRQDNAINLIESINKLFNGIVEYNADSMGKNLLRLKKLDEITADRVNVVLKAFDTIEATKETIKSLELEIDKTNKRLIEDCNTRLLSK